MSHTLANGTQAFLLEEDVLYITNAKQEYIFNDAPSRFIAEMLTSSADIDELSKSKHLKFRPQAYILRDWLINKGLVEAGTDQNRDKNVINPFFIDLSKKSTNTELQKGVATRKINERQRLEVRSYGYGDGQQSARTEWSNKMAETMNRVLQTSCISIKDSNIRSITLEVHANRIDMVSYETDKDLCEDDLVIPIIYNSERIEIGPIYQTKQRQYVDILNERVAIRTGPAHTLQNKKPFVAPNSIQIKTEYIEALSKIVGFILEEKLININDLAESQKHLWSINRNFIETTLSTEDPSTYVVTKYIHKLDFINEEQLLDEKEVSKISTIPGEYNYGSYTASKVPTIETLDRGDYKTCQVVDGGRRIYSTGKTRERIKPFIDEVTGVIEKVELTSINDSIYTYSGSKVFGTAIRAMKKTSNTARATGFPVSAAGKGRTAYQSQVSCIAEALERYSANFPILKIPEIKLRYCENPESLIHPNTIMQYSETQFENRLAINQSSMGMIHKVPIKFDENKEIYWTPIINMHDKENSKMIPTSMMGFNYMNNLQEGTGICCSNGLSSGNSVSEAMVQAIYEIIERDSCAIWWYNRLKVKRATIPSNIKSYIDDVISKLKELSRSFDLLYLPSDFPVHVIACVSHKSDGKQICVGLGSHSEYSVAVSRAVTEMYQMMVGETNKLNKKVDPDGNGGIEFIVQQWLLKEEICDHEYLISTDCIDSKLEINDCQNHHFISIEQELKWLLNLFKEKKMSVYGANYTSKSIGFPVAKVFIPGMRHFWPRFGPGRLYTLPVDLGYLKEAKTEVELNPIGFFF